MFRTAGLLNSVVCPAFREGRCENERVGCPFAHDWSLFEEQVARAKRRKLQDSVPESNAPQSQKAGAPVEVPLGSSSFSSRPRAENSLKATNVNGNLAVPIISGKAHPVTSKISLRARQDGLKKIHGTLSKFYQPLLTHQNTTMQAIGTELCNTHALAIELDVFRLANEHSYRNSSMSAAVSVTKRHKNELEDAIKLAEEALAESDSEKARTYLQQCTETGTNTEVNAKRELQRHKKAGKLTRERIVKAGFLCPKGDLQTLGYLTEIPTKWGPGGTKVNGIGEKHTCTRCSTLFRVAPLRRTKEEEGQDAEACRFHPGRPRREPTSDAKTRKVQRWTCCGRTVDAQALGDDRCAAGPHVFKEDSEEELHQRAAYTTFERLAQELDINDGALEVAALDCEMSYTTAGLSLTRVTLIDENGDIVLDELVRCTSGVQILDYNTQFSGIQPEDYEKNAVLDLDSIGHGLENDLRAIRIVHTNVVDTCQLFLHPRGLPFRMALRDLVAKYLGKIIQAGGSAVGHSSAEDAQTTLELVRYKWMELNS